MGFTALHHPLQYRPFAEVLQLIEAPFEFLEALCAAVCQNTPFRAPDRRRPAAHFNSPSMRLSAGSKPKAARCSACSSKPTCNNAATEMWDPRYTSLYLPQQDGELVYSHRRRRGRAPGRCVRCRHALQLAILQAQNLGGTENPMLRATAAADAHNASGIGKRPWCELRQRSKRR
jgi:hypothetical protein